MANSRTKILIPMLVLCFFAVTAYGQAVLSLGSNPTRVRSEGITEVVGLITLSNNTNAAQIIPGGTTISIVFDGTITNDPGISTLAIGAVGYPDRNIYTTGKTATDQSSTPLNGATPMTIATSGATLTLSIPTGFTNGGLGVCATGTVGANLCLIPGGSLNIQGVRVNVSGLTGNIFATLTTTPANAITFPGGANATVVGRAQATLGGVTATGAALAQCGIPQAPVSSTTPAKNDLGNFYTAGGGLNLAAPGASGANPYTTKQVMSLAVSEPGNFPTAFSAATGSAAGAAAVWDEAGITPGGTGAGVAGTGAGTFFQGTASPVTKGVQLVMVFTGLPGSVSLVVPTTFTNTTGTTTSTQVMNLVSPTPSPALAVGQANVIASSGGAASVAYEFITTSAASPTTVDTVTFVFGFSAPAGTIVPVGSLGAVNVSVGPTSTVTTFTQAANATLRFAANPGLNATSIGTVNACLTNLLFPFVSNRTGTTFNTGIAISNTASDSGTTKGETGGIIAYFYGVSAPTGGFLTVPIPATSTGGTTLTAGVIAPGEHTAFVLNNGSTTAIAPGFQGYIVALCQFRYAHGLATIFDNFGVGPANVGFSYLALVLNGTATGRTGTNNVAAGTDSTGLGH